MVSFRYIESTHGTNGATYGVARQNTHMFWEGCLELSYQVTWTCFSATGEARRYCLAGVDYPGQGPLSFHRVALQAWWLRKRRMRFATCLSTDHRRQLVRLWCSTAAVSYVHSLMNSRMEHGVHYIDASIILPVMLPVMLHCRTGTNRVTGGGSCWPVAHRSAER
jgi:hypothetical protein